MNAFTDVLRLSRALSAVLRSPPHPRPNLHNVLLRLTLLPHKRPPPPPSNSSPPPSRSPPHTPPPSSTSPSPTSPTSPTSPNPPTSSNSPTSPTSPPSPPHPPPPPSESPSAKLHTTFTANPSLDEPIHTTRAWTPRERRVPESPLSRVAAFGSLGLGLVAGAAAESARRAVGMSTNEPGYSAFISEANAERLARSLSRMRGAALKLGQMLSIQDEKVVPPEILAALERVRQGADVMPAAQLERVMVAELGEGWRERVVEFEDDPFAAASIGQVHRGKVKVEGRKEVVEVVFKVQYPGVARSIRSDLGNLKRLVVSGGFLPDQWFVDEALKVAEEELERECNYELERGNQERYRELVMGNEELREMFYVPRVFEEFSTKRVLVSEYVAGVPVDRVKNMDKEVRDRVGEMLLRLTLSELFVFAFQQSDPNWSNYMYDAETGKINLIDFGAARAYDEGFLLRYLGLIRACAARDRDALIKSSIDLGFLTGEESARMIDAHVQASFAVGEPFQKEKLVSGFDFTGNDIPARAAQFGKVMLEDRLTPPPKEVYSLHRRLSGAFLMSMKLGSTIRAAELLEEMVTKLVKEGKLDK